MHTFLITSIEMQAPRQVVLVTLYLIGLSVEHDDEGFSARLGHPMTSGHTLVGSHDYSA